MLVAGNDAFIRGVKGRRTAVYCSLAMLRETVTRFS
jgi:hypothetical protein